MIADDFSPRLNYPYLLGVYLAVNAIPDAYLLIDGPDCAQFKAEFIFGSHDLFSTLLRSDNENRIITTQADTKNVCDDRADVMRDLLSRMDRSARSGALMVCSMPMATIVGTDYARVVADLRPRLRKPFFNIPARSLSGDWLDGYAQVLETLASGLEARPNRRPPTNVAVVGYLMDRTEADHTANIVEISRMLVALGLKPVSIWPSNSPLSTLRRISRAGTVISLPYGRTAARILAEKLGAFHIETDTPFGIRATHRWLRTIASALGRERQAETFIEREMVVLAHRLEWAIPKYFLNKRAIVCCEPFLWKGLMELLGDVGVQVIASLLSARRDHAEISTVDASHAVFSEPRMALAQEELRRLTQSSEVDFTIGAAHPHFGNILPGVTHVDLGFPSYSYHALTDSPFLGFRGVLSFLQRMADATAKGRIPRSAGETASGGS